MGEASVDPSPPESGDLSLRMGKRAVDRGMITPEQLRKALSHHAAAPAPGEGSTPRLGVILRDKGYITSTQLEALLQEERASASSMPAIVPQPPPARVALPGPGQPLGSFGKFALLSEVGRGGMGVVFEAHDNDLDRRAALKLLLSSPNADPKEVALDAERFIREARLSAKLKHPHIVTVYDAGVVDGRRYIAMEFIDGQPFSDWRRKGSVTIRQQVSILRDIALAVHHAHELGIIHRDLKPANVLIDGRNEPHVADFGLAKRVGHNVAQSFTAEGRVVGTPTYMSPEQVRGSQSVDRRSDIYSMGVMLYEILTGRLPFEGETAMEVMMKAANDPVRAPSKITTLQMNPVIFTALEAICLKAMSRAPDDRYPDARKFAEDLSRWLEGHRVRAAKRWFRRRAGWIAMAAVAVVLLAAGLGMSRFRSRLRPSEDPALAKAAPASPSPSGSQALNPIPSFTSVVFEAGRPSREAGLRLKTADTDDCRVEEFNGVAALRCLRADGQPAFLHFDVEDSWASTVPMAEIELQFFDAGPAWSNFSVEYDSMDPRWPHDGTFKRAGLVVLDGSRKWRSARFIVATPRLENRMDHGSDIRLGTERSEILLHRIELRPWTPLPAFAGPPAGAEAARLRPGLLGEYHVGVELADPRRRIVDADLVFDWGEGSAWDGGPIDRFSIRWTGGVRAPAKGRYLVEVQSDDGARVFVGGRAVISNWTEHAPMTDAAICDLEAGFYPIQVEYFEETGGAYLRVCWFQERLGRMWPVDPPPYFHVATSERPK
jgi:serine/threonine protein kinase